MHRRPRLTSASPRTHHRRATVALLLGAVGGLSACSGAVEVADAPLAEDPACAKVAAAWPTTVANQAVVETTGAGATVRAWGDPTIVARCGVPALTPTTEQCIEADGLGWVVSDLSDGVRLTTYGKDPAVEILVPEAYAPAPLLLPAFADAAAALPDNGRSCL
ncbi:MULTISPECIES: DUF3515 family protein [unclassified Janibacter]|uniref:DUF3515 family protein n=1 Tax=unclassified Janibacter TaxID=2649294 RepID=UPI003D076A4A